MHYHNYCLQPRERIMSKFRFQAVEWFQKILKPYSSHQVSTIDPSVLIYLKNITLALQL